jgi:hypothetical protein
VIAIAVPVIVNVADRAGPLLAATVNWTVPLPVPDAPWVTVRNVALLTAVHAQVDAVVTVMAAVPPAAPNAVVVVPVMIWHPPPGYVVDELLGPPQATAISSSAAPPVTRARRERWPDRNLFMSTLFEELVSWRIGKLVSSCLPSRQFTKSATLQLNDATYQVTRRVMPSVGLNVVPSKSLWHSRHWPASSTAET